MNLPCKKWKSHEWTNESCVRGFSWVACCHEISMECIHWPWMSEFSWVYHQSSPWIIHEILAVKILLKIYEIISWLHQAFYRYNFMDFHGFFMGNSHENSLAYGPWKFSWFSMAISWYMIHQWNFFMGTFFHGYIHGFFIIIIRVSWLTLQ